MPGQDSTVGLELGAHGTDLVTPRTDGDLPWAQGSSPGKRDKPGAGSARLGGQLEAVRPPGGESKEPQSMLRVQLTLRVPGETHEGQVAGGGHSLFHFLQTPAHTLKERKNNTLNTRCLSPFLLPRCRQTFG